MKINLFYFIIILIPYSNAAAQQRANCLSINFDICNDHIGSRCPSIQNQTLNLENNVKEILQLKGFEFTNDSSVALSCILEGTGLTAGASSLKLELITPITNIPITSTISKNPNDYCPNLINQDSSKQIAENAVLKLLNQIKKNSHCIQIPPPQLPPQPTLDSTDIPDSLLIPYSLDTKLNFPKKHEDSLIFTYYQTPLSEPILIKNIARSTLTDNLIPGTYRFSSKKKRLRLLVFFSISIAGSVAFKVAKQSAIKSRNNSLANDQSSKPELWNNLGNIFLGGVGFTYALNRADICKSRKEVMQPHLPKKPRCNIFSKLKF